MSFTEVPEFESHFHFQSNFLAMCTLREVKSSGTWVFATHVEDLERVPYYWLQPGTAPAIVGIGKVKTMDGVSLSLPLSPSRNISRMPDEKQRNQYFTQHVSMTGDHPKQYFH